MLNILMIEDSESDAFSIQRALKNYLGQDVTCFHVNSLRKGSALLQEGKKKVDLIMLDLGLPDSAGPVDTYKQVKAWADQMPIVVMTSVNDHDLARLLVQEGAQDYLNKDMLVKDPGHIKEAIDFAIERHKLHKTLKASKADLEHAAEEKDAILNCFMGGYSASGK